MRHKKKRHRRIRKLFGLGGGSDDGVEDADTITESNLQRMTPGRSSGGLWWWVIARMPSTLRFPSGQVVVRGAFATEEQAMNKGEQLKVEDYQTVQLPTRDQNRATRLWRNSRVEKGENLERAMERQRHQGQGVDS